MITHLLHLIIFIVIVNPRLYYSYTLTVILRVEAIVNSHTVELKVKAIFVVVAQVI